MSDSKVLTSYSKADARSVGESFITKSELYGFSGKAASCIDARQLNCDGCWQFKCTFRESDGNLFGGKIHNVDLTVKGSVVTSAVMDGNISMM